jgi:hypothetical protein
MFLFMYISPNLLEIKKKNHNSIKKNTRHDLASLNTKIQEK